MTSSQDQTNTSELWRPVAAWDREEVAHPRADLLDAATDRLGHDPTRVRWNVETLPVRHRSQLFRVEGQIEGLAFPVAAWYKVGFAAGSADGVDRERLESFRQGLRRGEALAEAFARHPDRPPSLTLAPLLALDTHELVTITTEVPGVSLGRMARLDPRALARAPRRYRRVGEALRLIEAVSSAPDLAETKVRPRIDNWLHHDDSFLDAKTRRSIEQRFDALFDQLAQADRATTYAHGDVSDSNVRVQGAEVGLIDAEWRPRLLGFDLATFIVRLERQRFQLGPWARLLVHEVQRGYGEPGPGYQIERSQRLLRLVRNLPPADRARVLDELTERPT